MSVKPARSAPERIVLEGRYVRLEPLERHHAADLLVASIGEGVPERYRWLFEYAPTTQAEAESFVERMNAGGDRFVAVVDKLSGRALGRQGWLRLLSSEVSYKTTYISVGCESSVAGHPILCQTGQLYSNISARCL